MVICDLQLQNIRKDQKKGLYQLSWKQGMENIGEEEEEGPRTES